MSLQFLFQLGLAGILLSVAAYIGTKVRPGVDTPLAVAARVTAFGVVAVLYLLCLARNLGLGVPLEVVLNTMAARVKESADLWLSRF